jgi:hypothetical protein
MLPGGIDILGFYHCDMASGRGRKLFHLIFDSLLKFEYYKKMKFTSNRRLLFVVERGGKSINMKSIDINDLKSSPQQCDITIKKDLFKNEFYTLNSNLKMKTFFTTPNIKSHNLLKENFYRALSVDDMFDENKYICLINNCLLENSKQFNESKSQIPLNDITKQKTESPSDSSIKTKDTSFHHTYNATLMENLARNNNTANNNKKDQLKPITDNKCLDSIYDLTGKCNLIVIFHETMSIEYLKCLLIYDLMRSLYARIRLLIEDLDASRDIIGDAQLEDPDKDVSTIEELYQTPNRIHVRLNDNGNEFMFCDYVFPDETCQDISERVHQVLGIEINDTENDIRFIEDIPSKFCFCFCLII